MKQVIYSTGFFETNLTIDPPSERFNYNVPHVTMARHNAIVQTPKYELRKTSQCLTKFVIEEGDRLILQDLNIKANQALKDLRDRFIGLNECHAICDKAKRFREIYDKAQSNYSEPYKNVWYIETADETSRGCQAFYQFNDGVVISEHPCKVGEVLELKYDSVYGYFSPIKIKANKEEIKGL